MLSPPLSLTTIGLVVVKGIVLINLFVLINISFCPSSTITKGNFIGLKISMVNSGAIIPELNGKETDLYDFKVVIAT